MGQKIGKLRAGKQSYIYRIYRLLLEHGYNPEPSQARRLLFLSAWGPEDQQRETARQIDKLRTLMNCLD
jgi:hypothetical protein